MARFMPIALAATLLALPAAAQSLPPPPSMNDPVAADAGNPAPKPRTAKPAKPAGEAAKPAVKAEAKTAKASTKTAPKPSGYSDGVPLPRNIDPRDIDDPYGGVGSSGNRI